MRLSPVLLLAAGLLAAAIVVPLSAPAAAPSASAGRAIAAPAATSAAAASCRNLTVPRDLRTALTAAHHTPSNGAISRGSIYYGRCGATAYAIASFSRALADQPEKFRKLPGRGWKDMGDGFEDGCSAGARAPIPRALVRLWGTCRR